MTGYIDQLPDDVLLDVFSLLAQPLQENHVFTCTLAIILHHSIDWSMLLR